MKYRFCAFFGTPCVATFSVLAVPEGIFVKIITAVYSVYALSPPDMSYVMEGAEKMQPSYRD